MDNQRLILFFALAIVTILLWEAWQRDHMPPVSPSVPTASISDTPALPPASNSSAPAPNAAAVPPPLTPELSNASPPPLQATLNSAQRVIVKTDTFEIEFDSIGADVRQAKLLQYPVSADQRDKPFVILSDRQQPLFVAQSGLQTNTQTSGVYTKAPDHHAVYKSPQSEYILEPGTTELSVPFIWDSGDGLKVTKTYVFRPGSYVIDVTLHVDNQTGLPWQGRFYRQLQREGEDSGGLVPTYTGGVIYSEAEKYEKIDFGDMDDANLNRTISGGWLAMIQHYFLGAWIPDAKESNLFYSVALGNNRYVLGMVTDTKEIATNASGEFSRTQLFLGPKVQNMLEKLAPGLELTVDYGWLTVIAKPLFWLLSWSESVVGNWGWAIAIVTLMVKLLFFPLSAASYRSMANMRKLQPKITALRERYGDDRQRMSQAMMEIYKKEKINPFGGCLPILIQIPVFIALYWVLLESVELRQAPFIFWINDLSTKDPFYVLPVLMGISMLIQMKLNPPPPDPIQAKVMMALPIIFTFFFAFFPSGLVWYWVVNNVLSILQQWHITRATEKQSAIVKSS